MTHQITENARIAKKVERARVCEVAANMAAFMKKRRKERELRKRAKEYQS